MRKIYYLSTCSTCSRIIKELELTKESIEMQDIKTNLITNEQLTQMHDMTDKYKSLFSKRSIKFKAWELGSKNLTEDDFKKYILEEYTFLKRPVIIWDDQIFIGNSKKVVEAANLVINS
ncbi:MAG: arsenate reductase [Reichenbachiella sp.]